MTALLHQEKKVEFIVDEAFSVLKSLEETSLSTYVLKHQCAVANKIFSSLKQDVTKNREWFENNSKESYVILNILQNFLRFIQRFMIVGGTSRKDLLMLRKSVTLLNIHDIKTQFTTLWWQLDKSLEKATKENVVGTETTDLFILEMTEEDFDQTMINVAKTFRKITTWKKDSYISNISESLLQLFSFELIDEKVGFEIFAQAKVTSAAKEFALLLLALDPRPGNERLLSKVDPGQNIIVIPKLIGKFGHILNTDLKFRDGTNSGNITLQVVPKKDLKKTSAMFQFGIASELSLLMENAHPSILSVLGFTIQYNCLWVALEPIHRRLDKIIHADVKIRLNEGETLAIASSVADALCFLHSKGIVHGEVRPMNIFVPAGVLSQTPSTCAAKLANLTYGLNSYDSKWSFNHQENGLVYQAPEVLRGEEPTWASDMYSYAITLWEICKDDESPFQDLIVTMDSNELREKIICGERPKMTFPTDMFPWTADAMDLLWTEDEWKRSTAQSFKNYLQAEAENVEIKDFDPIIMEFGRKLLDLTEREPSVLGRKPGFEAYEGSTSATSRKVLETKVSISSLAATIDHRESRFSGDSTSSEMLSIFLRKSPSRVRRKRLAPKESNKGTFSLPNLERGHRNVFHVPTTEGNGKEDVRTTSTTTMGTGTYLRSEI